jgi:hypothetical protein
MMGGLNPPLEYDAPGAAMQIERLSRLQFGPPERRFAAGLNRA